MNTIRSRKLLLYIFSFFWVFTVEAKIDFKDAKNGIWEPLPKPFSELGYRQKLSPKTQLIILPRKAHQETLDLAERDNEFALRFSKGIRQQLLQKGYTKVQVGLAQRRQVAGATEVFFSVKYRDLMGRPTESFERHRLHRRGGFSGTLIQVLDNRKPPITSEEAQVVLHKIYAQ